VVVLANAIIFSDAGVGVAIVCFTNMHSNQQRTGLLPSACPGFLPRAAQPACNFGTANGSWTTNSKPSGLIIMMAQSETLTEEQSVHIY